MGRGKAATVSGTGEEKARWEKGGNGGGNRGVWFRGEAAAVRRGQWRHGGAGEIEAVIRGGESFNKC
jgi:hypothetical protein